MANILDTTWKSQQKLFPVFIMFREHNIEFVIYKRQSEMRRKNQYWWRKVKVMSLCLSKHGSLQDQSQAQLVGQPIHSLLGISSPIQGSILLNYEPVKASISLVGLFTYEGGKVDGGELNLKGFLTSQASPRKWLRKKLISLKEELCQP